jgi:hypothetical protein
MATHTDNPSRRRDRQIQRASPDKIARFQFNERLSQGNKATEGYKNTRCNALVYAGKHTGLSICICHTQKTHSIHMSLHTYTQTHTHTKCTLYFFLISFSLYFIMSLMFKRVSHNLLSADRKSKLKEVFLNCFNP